jgi:hypothetical protein
LAPGALAARFGGHRGRHAPLLLCRASHLAGDLPLAVPASLDHCGRPVLAPPTPSADSVEKYVTESAVAVGLGLLGPALWLAVRGVSTTRPPRRGDRGPRPIVNPPVRRR